MELVGEPVDSVVKSSAPGCCNSQFSSSSSRGRVSWIRCIGHQWQSNSSWNSRVKSGIVFSLGGMTNNGVKELTFFFISKVLGLAVDLELPNEFVDRLLERVGAIVLR